MSDRLKLNDSEIFVAEYYKADLVGFVPLYPIFSSTRMQQPILSLSEARNIKNENKDLLAVEIEENVF